MEKIFFAFLDELAHSISLSIDSPPLFGKIPENSGLFLLEGFPYRLTDSVTESLKLLFLEWNVIYIYLYTNVISRSVLVKYSDRGLADDVFWFNGGLKLFETLFWIINIFLMLAHETNITILFFTGRMYSSLQR